MSVEVSSNDRLLLAGSLVQETESAAWGTIHIVDVESVVAVPQSGLLCICGVPVQVFHITLDVIPYVGNYSLTALTLTWVCSVSSYVGITG